MPGPWWGGLGWERNGLEVEEGGLMGESSACTSEPSLLIPSSASGLEPVSTPTPTLPNTNLTFEPQLKKGKEKLSKDGWLNQEPSAHQPPQEHNVHFGISVAVVKPALFGFAAGVALVGRMSKFSDGILSFLSFRPSALIK